MLTNLNERYFQNRIFTLKRKIETITSLRQLVLLPPELDILSQQWFAINIQLSLVASRLLKKVQHVSKELLPDIREIETARELNSELAIIEKELSKAYIFFDIILDALTPRLSPKLGLLLRGCDVIAFDALKQINRPVISTVMPPLIVLDRGFGASIMREGVPAPGRAKNPIATIQIPYEKIKQKYLLVSILHEIGHQQDAVLGLRSEAPKALRSYMKERGASKLIQDLFSNWLGETIPDLIAFLILGAAQTVSTREILSFVPSMVFRVSLAGTHPPPWLRIRFSVDWCRRLWGFGPWDGWEKEWIDLYSLDDSDEKAPTASEQKMLKSAQQYISMLTSFLFGTKFKTLGNQTIPSIFHKKPMHPMHIQKIIDASNHTGILKLGGMTACQQLAVFVIMRYTERNISEENIDKLMTSWLIGLGQNRQ